MKVLHSGTLDVNAGGPAMSTYYTLYGLRQQGINAEIIMYPLSATGKLKGENVPVHYAKAPWEHKLAYSPSLKKEIELLGDYDIYHAQGIWQYPTYAIIDIAHKKKKPYLITPRGMLYPQDIQKSNQFLKKISLKLRLLNDFNHAACVQVTCVEEMLHCRKLGITAPIAIIPNPIEIKNYTEKKKDKIFRLGYLGRLSPRKNVESLIYAFHELKDITTDAELLIIGGGDEKYEKFLKEEVKKYNLNNVKFTGFLSGEEKDKAIASLSVLAMPSEFENLGNVILEGLIRGIPCIATKGSPWEELENHQCGWWIDYNQGAITKTIKKAMELKDEDLHLMGQNGYKLIINKYSVEAIAKSMCSLYKAILDNNLKSIDFCYFNE